MGFFKNKIEINENDIDTNNQFLEKLAMEKENYKIDKKDKKDKTDEEYLDVYCDQIIDATYQLEDVKIEYGLVSDYLTDIQKIEELPLEKREVVNDIARKLVQLGNDRISFQNSSNKINNAQYKNISKFESEVPNALDKLKGYEEQNAIIKNDLRMLESEKVTTEFDKDKIYETQNLIKTILISIIAVIGVSIAIFMWISVNYNIDMTITYLVCILIGVFFTAIFFSKFKNLNDKIRYNDLKINKLITLTNKIKIKLINNTNTLDYLYNKYNVGSRYELEMLWNEYVEAITEQQKYKRTSDDLNFYNEKLISVLSDINVSNPDVWLHQAIAIIDSKEMVEVKHYLNVRRQKLREQIDYNEELKKTGFEKIKDMLDKKAYLRDYVISTLASYNIVIDS